MSLTDVIDDYCRQQGMSIAKFERLCNLGNGVIGKWKKGIARPSVGSIMRIQITTGLPVTHFIRG